MFALKEGSSLSNRKLLMNWDEAIQTKANITSKLTSLKKHMIANSQKANWIDLPEKLAQLFETANFF